MSGRQLIGTATTTPRALHVLPSPARQVTVSPAIATAATAVPVSMSTPGASASAAREAAPAVRGRVRKARHETCQPAVPGDRAERIGRSAAFRRGSAHELPPAEQEVAHRWCGRERLDVVGGRERPDPSALVTGRRGVARDAPERPLEYGQLVPGHRQAMTQDTVRAPAQVEAVREVADRLSIALELGPHEAVLRGEPRAAELDEPAPELGGIAATADAVARLEHDDRSPRPRRDHGQLAGRRARRRSRRRRPRMDSCSPPRASAPSSTPHAGEPGVVGLEGEARAEQGHDRGDLSRRRDGRAEGDRRGDRDGADEAPVAAADAQCRAERARSPIRYTATPPASVIARDASSSWNGCAVASCIAAATATIPNRIARWQ